MKSYSCLYFHIVWSTKNRYPFLAEKLRPHIHNYINLLAKKKRINIIALGGTYDHIHMLIKTDNVKPIEPFIRHIKSSSSCFIKRTHCSISDFAWQKGFSVFTVSPSNVKKITFYINNQEAHHKTHEFDDEINALFGL